MSTDTNERGLERRIRAALTGSSCDAASTQQGPNGKAAVPTDRPVNCSAAFSSCTARDRCMPVTGVSGLKCARACYARKQ